MNKLLSISSALLTITLLTASFSISVQAQDDYTRLYEEFLQRIQNTPSTPSQASSSSNSPSTTPASTTPAPTQKQPVATKDYTLTGRIIRNDQGVYLLATQDKPTRYYRVYGQELSTEIIKAVVYDAVQLIGEKAYYQGKLVGISVHQLIPLSGGAPSSRVQTPAPKTTQPIATTPGEPSSNIFYGTIEISAQGAPYLISYQDKRRYSRRLLNSVEWKKAFQHAYKGEVRVNGYLTDGGAIRFTDIVSN